MRKKGGLRLGGGEEKKPQSPPRRSTEDFGTRKVKKIYMFETDWEEKNLEGSLSRREEASRKEESGPNALWIGKMEAGTKGKSDYVKRKLTMQGSKHQKNRAMGGKRNAVHHSPHPL